MSNAEQRCWQKFVVAPMSDPFPWLKINRSRVELIFSAAQKDASVSALSLYSRIAISSPSFVFANEQLRRV
jgi:hypothetical protein